MGWSFRQLNGKASHNLDPETLATKQRDLVRTAFDEQVDLPPEFVSPRSAATASRKKSKTKSCCVETTTRIYSKHDTGPTTTRATAQGASSVRKNHGERPAIRSNEPVDFVYDVNVRRKLREQIDHERASVRQEVKAKQTQMKAANLWLNEPPQALEDHCVRKQAWAQSSSKKHTTKTHPGPAGPCPSPEPDGYARASTQATTANSTRSTAAAKAQKSSSFAPNVSMRRAQPASSSVKHSASPRQKPTQRQREAEEVEHTLDAFDARLDSWSI